MFQLLGSSYSQGLCGTNVLRNFVKFTGKDPRESISLVGYVAVVTRKIISQLMVITISEVAGHRYHRVAFLKTFAKFMRKHLRWRVFSPKGSPSWVLSC